MQPRNKQEGKEKNILVRNSFDNLKDLEKYKIFLQIKEWLIKDQSKINNYSDKLNLAQRRGDQMLSIYKKKSENTYKVLKTYNLRKDWTQIVCFIYDSLVPFLTNNQWMIAFSDMFISEDVNSLYLISNIYLYVTFWLK